MGLFDFIKPEERLRWGVIGLILLFVLSSAVVYLNQTPVTSSGVSSSSTPADSLGTFNGSGQANATLMSWDSSIVVIGNGTSQVESQIAAWRTSGLITSDANRSDGRLLKLSDSSQVFNTSAKLLSLGMGVFGDAVISLGPVAMQGQGISRTVSGNTFQMRIPPTYEIGDTVPVSFNGAVVDGSLYSIFTSSLLFGASSPLETVVRPLEVSTNTTFWRVSVPWAYRNLDALQYQLDLPGGSKVTYRARSYALLPNATAAQLTSLQAQLPPFATHVDPTGQGGVPLLGIQPNYTNQTEAEASLRAMGLAPVFPDTPMDVWAYPATIWNDTPMIPHLQEIWDGSFPKLKGNFNPEFIPTYRLKIQLPENMEVGGKSYLLTNRTLEMNSLYPAGPDGVVVVRFTPIGRRVASYNAAEYKPLQLLLGLPVPDGNETSPVNQTNTANSTVWTNASAPTLNVNASPNMSNPKQTNGTVQTNATVNASAG